MNNENKNKLSTRQLVSCGILLAVSLVLLYLASVIPGMELTLMAAVGAIVFIVCANNTFRLGRIFYVASVLLALIVAPGKVLILPYIFCLGPYGLIKYGVEKFTSKFESKSTQDSDLREKEAPNKAAQNNMIDIRLSDDEEEYVPMADIQNEDLNNADMNGEETKAEKTSKAKKYIIEYTLKLIGFVTCLAICFLFIMFVMGLSPTTLMLGGNIVGAESELFAKIGVGLTYTILVIAAILVFILYDNIIRLINIVFGKYVR